MIELLLPETAWLNSNLVMLKLVRLFLYSERFFLGHRFKNTIHVT